MFISFVNIQCYGASDFEAPNAALPILSRLEMGKVVDCRTRVEFAKSVINNHSTASGETVTMRTPIPELMELWNRDYAFVVREMELAQEKLPEGNVIQEFNLRIGNPEFQECRYESRTRNLSNIRSAVTILNGHVLRDADMMSFGYLNYINRLLAEYLSRTHGSDGALKDLYSKDHDIYNTPQFIGSLSGFSIPAENEAHELASMLGEVSKVNNRVDTHIALTHVSKTALIPFDAMIESLAFGINGQNYAFGFIGVGTNPALTYDGVEADSGSTWQHDKRHVVGMTYNIDEMAQFKELMEVDYQNPSVQYIMYEYFHEGSYWKFPEFCALICESGMSKFRERFDANSAGSHVVVDAEYLKKKRDGVGFDNTSAASRLEGYRSFVLEGYAPIRPKAQLFLDQLK
ncbi:MAG: hypothetical protein NWQ29_01105 [Alphaproteobacteria bacterium]|nr:hypothetical protein [Alphaproteobacteria bacterium]